MKRSLASLMLVVAGAFSLYGGAATNTNVGIVTYPALSNWVKTNIVAGTNVVLVTNGGRIQVNVSNGASGGAFIANLNGVGTNLSIVDKATIGLAAPQNGPALFLYTSNLSDFSSLKMQDLGTGIAGWTILNNTNTQELTLGLVNTNTGNAVGNFFMELNSRITDGTLPYAKGFGFRHYVFDGGPQKIYNNYYINPTNGSFAFFKGRAEGGAGQAVMTTGPLALYIDGTNGVQNFVTSVSNSFAGTGTIAITGQTVTGTGTSFFTQLDNGDLITSGVNNWRVLRVSSATSARVLEATTLGAGASYTINKAGFISRGLASNFWFGGGDSKFLVYGESGNTYLTLGNFSSTFQVWSLFGNGTAVGLVDEADGSVPFRIDKGADNDAFIIDSSGKGAFTNGVGTTAQYIYGPTTNRPLWLGASNMVTNGAITIGSGLIGTTNNNSITITTNGGASGGSQTPWISDIDGGGFNLTNVLNSSAQQGYFGILTVSNASTLSTISAGTTVKAGLGSGFVTVNSNQFSIAATGWTNTNVFNCVALVTATAATATLSDGTNTIRTFTGITQELEIPMHPSYKLTAAGGLAGVAIAQ